MLRWRFTSAAAIILPLALLLLADYFASGPAPGVWLLPVAVLVAALAVAEVLDLLKQQDWPPAAWTVYCGTLMIVLASSVPVLRRFFGAGRPWTGPLEQLGWPTAALAAGLLLALAGEMLRYEKPGGAIVRVALSWLAMTYVGLFMSFLMALRCYRGNETGMAALASLLLVVKLSDTGAYACGRIFGRHKMSPRLSPGKTVEGAAGGVVAACAASWAVFRWVAPHILGSPQSQTQGAGWLWYGLVVAVFGMVGDLAMSMFKRDVGRKDSSRWLPGLGGVLDVLDSVLASAPAAYFCWVAGVVGPTAR